MSAEIDFASRDYVLLSANPRSGSRNRQPLVQELKKRIHERGLTCEIHTNLDEMSSRAHDLDAKKQLRTVVAAGGDGTAAAVASLIPPAVPVTLFPTGSENLLAKHLNVTPEPQRIADAIQRMKIKTMDAMEVNGKLALLMASVGFDAEVVRRVHSTRRSHITRWTYWKSILAASLTYRWSSIRVDVLDAQNRIVETHIGKWVFVFNVPRYAAGLQIMPDANDQDGMLDVGIFGPGGLISGLINYASVLRGTHASSQNWKRVSANSVRVHHAQDLKEQSNVPTCQTDGDWASELPITIRSLPNRLKLVLCDQKDERNP